MDVEGSADEHQEEISSGSYVRAWIVVSYSRNNIIVVGTELIDLIQCMCYNNHPIQDLCQLRQIFRRNL